MKLEINYINKGWYKRKKYPHFDMSLSYQNAWRFVKSFSKNPTYAFKPLIQFQKVSKRYRTKKELIDGKKVKVLDKSGSIHKIRNINYPAHKDGYIYAYYSYQLLKKYEIYLKQIGISDCVCAYRKKRGTNIQIVSSVFEYIKEIKDCFCYAFDIKSFFDNIDHENLRLRWSCILATKNLPLDHYKVYKSITRYTYIHRDFLPKDEFGNLIKPVCGTGSDLRKFRPQFKINQQRCGIPQGTQISALLSNIYMVDFDCIVANEIRKMSGIYRRYADDILIIVPTNLINVERLIEDSLRITSNNYLTLNETKTEKIVFKNGVIVPEISNKPFLQYLGFIYDGKSLLIRSGTLSQYWRKLIRAARRKIILSKKDKLQRGIFKNYLYSQYTQLGKYKNFHSYAKKAIKDFSKIFKTELKIKKQLKKHMKILKSEMSGIRTTKKNKY